MRGILSSLLFVILVALGVPAQAKVDYVPPRPLADVVTAPVQACGPASVWNMDYITWGGDMITLYGNGNAKTTTPGSIFAKAGLNIQLTREDNLQKQVAAFLKCETPFLRGTVAMAVMAADYGAVDPRVELVPLVQLTWSAGADTIVYEPGIKSASDIDTFVAQAYGPHTDWVVKTILDSGRKVKDVKVFWTTDLVGLEGSTPGASFREDKSVDAAFVISPDATALTAGSGTGGDDAVKGALIGFSTGTANHVIADIIFVRRDFYEAHKAEIAKFQNAFFLSSEGLKTFMGDRKSPAYKEGIKKLAVLLLDSDGTQSVADTEGMYDGANFVGWKGNVSFFADKNEPRSFKTVWTEASTALDAMGFVRKTVTPPDASWDYNALKAGLKDTNGVAVPAVDLTRAKQVIATREREGTLESGQVFKPFSVMFEVNQTAFSPDKYSADFDLAINAIKTYGGAIVTIEGNVDPYKYLKEKQNGATEVALKQIEQAGINTSLERARALRDALISYAAAKHIKIDGDSVQTIGHGFKHPATGMCGADPCMPKNRADQMSNMRAEIRINIVPSEELLPE